MGDLRLENVSLTYQNSNAEKTLALEKVSALFKEGTCSVFLGASGSGKTSLLRSMAGLEPYEGTIYYGERNALDIPRNEKALSYVNQDYALYPFMSVFDNIAYPLKVMGLKKEEILPRVKEMAQELEIVACLSRKPREISLGQRQRTALARALIKKPDYCFFDEPLSNLDAPTRLQIRTLLKKLFQKRTLTAFYATHSLQEALSLADTLYVLEKGRIVLSGKPLEIYNSKNPLLLAMEKEEGL
jgi:ABC-type sugar transport system ATPase subunit